MLAAIQDPDDRAEFIEYHDDWTGNGRSEADRRAAAQALLRGEL